MINTNIDKKYLEAGFEVDRYNAEVLKLQNKDVELNKELDIERLVLAVLTELEEESKKATIEFIEQYVSYGLNVVFSENEYQFKVNVKNNLSLDFSIIKNGIEMGIERSHGGGVVDVVSFILRLIFIIRHPANLKKFMVLDEQFNAIHGETYLENLGLLINELVDKWGLDVLLVSQNNIEKLSRLSYQMYSIDKEKELSGLRKL